MRKTIFLALGLTIASHAFACEAHHRAPENALLSTYALGPKPLPEWVMDLPEDLRRVAIQTQPPTEKAAPVEDPSLKVDDPALQKDIDADIAWGKKIIEEAAKELKYSKSTQFTDRLNRIGAEMAKIANENRVEASWGDRRFSKFPYQFYVLEGDDVNAFSIPGGYLFFYEGFMKNVESDNELAGVIAHEIAHASLRHVATLQREQSRTTAITLPLILIAILAGGEAGAGIAQGTSLLSTAIGSGWSVKAEKAADYAGFQYLAKSKYSPIGLLTFMERLAYEERIRGNVDWGIFRSHPPSRERSTTLIGLLRGAGIPIHRSIGAASMRAVPMIEENGTTTVRLMSRNIVTFAGEGNELRASDASKAVTKFVDTVPTVFDVSVVDGGKIVGSGNTLFTLTEDDAKNAKQELPIFVDKVARTLKAAIFELQHRITDQ